MSEYFLISVLHVVIVLPMIWIYRKEKTRLEERE